MGLPLVSTSPESLLSKRRAKSVLSNLLILQNLGSDPQPTTIGKTEGRNHLPEAVVDVG